MSLHRCFKFYHQQNTTTGSLFFLDPRYVIEIMDINSFNQSKHIYTKVLVKNMMPKLYDYIMAT